MLGIYVFTIFAQHSFWRLRWGNWYICIYNFCPTACEKLVVFACEELTMVVCENDGHYSWFGFDHYPLSIYAVYVHEVRYMHGEV